jgi:hypothetical protein
MKLMEERPWLVLKEEATPHRVLIRGAGVVGETRGT